MEREARCMCGQLSIKVQGDPSVCLVCNCNNCQRRTGSVFGVGAYFLHDQIVDKQGTPKKFHITSDSGNAIDSFFCSNCGSTLYLEAELFAGMVGIPVGCFTDPDFPEPTMSAWNQSKYHWVKHPEHWINMPQQTPDNP